MSYKYRYPIQHFSVLLTAALQLYLEGNGGRSVGQILNLNIPPRNKFRTHVHDIKSFIDQNCWNRFFAKNWHRMSMEDCLKTLFTGFENIAVESMDSVEPMQINIDNLMRISKSQLYGVGIDTYILENITNYLEKNSHLYRIAVINGSIGSGDYKPGWSDIDLFIILKRATLKSPDLLKQARGFARKLRQKVYNYCILQLHGAFYLTEYQLRYHVDQLLPIECLRNSKIYSDSDRVTLYQPSSNAYAVTYFNEHIYRSSKKLLSILPRANFFQKILLIHRIYAFPFAFLATQGILKYKKSSFTAIADTFSNLFRGINSFYSEVNRFYETWHIDELRTAKLRLLFQDYLDMRYLNKVLHPMEREIVNRIDYFYDRLMTKDRCDQFETYLETSRQGIADLLA